MYCQVLLGVLFLLIDIVADETIFLRKPSEKGPTVVANGIQCLDEMSKLYFRRNEEYTRANNILITHINNLTSPAAEISEGFLKLKNKNAINVTYTKKMVYQIRVISDDQKLINRKWNPASVLAIDYYIIISDSISRIDNLLRKYVSKVASWNPGAKFLILLNNPSANNESYQSAQELFEILLMDFYINRVVMLYAINVAQYDIYVLDAFNEKKCRQVNVLRPGPGLCDNGKVQSALLTTAALGRSLKNTAVKNCTFYICTAIAPPFVETNCVSGIEMNLLAVIAEKMGFKVNLTCAQEERGIKNPNGTWTSLLGKLDSRQCDFIFGGFYPDNEVHDDFWTTDPYMSDSYTWYVQLAPLKAPWKGLFEIFDIELWIVFILTFLICWVTWLGLSRKETAAHKSLSLTAINTWGLLIGAAIFDRPEYSALRFFFIVLCLFALVVTTTYTSKLITVFTDPAYEEQIDTIAKMLKSGIPYGGPMESRDWFEEDPEIYENYNGSEDFDLIRDNLIDVMKGKQALLANRMYVHQSQWHDDVFEFKQNVFSSPLEIIMKSGFPFQYQFNVIIRQIRDGGLFEKINNDFIWYNDYLVKISKQRPHEHDAAIVLTPQHVQGAFFILIIGLLLSTLAFIMEFAIFYKTFPWIYKKMSVKWVRKTLPSTPIKRMNPRRVRNTNYKVKTKFY